MNRPSIQAIPGLRGQRTDDVSSVPKKGGAPFAVLIEIPFLGFWAFLYFRDLTHFLPLKSKAATSS